RSAWPNPTPTPRTINPYEAPEAGNDIGAGAPVEPSLPWNGKDILLTVLGGVVGLIVASLVIAVSYALVADDDASFTSTLVILELVSYGIFFASLWYFVIRRKGATWADIGFKQVPGTTYLLMVPIAIGLLIGSGLIALWVRSTFSDVPTAEDQLAIEDALTKGEFLWLFFATGVVAPVVEETFFRGVLYRYLRLRWTVPLAMVVSALLFAIVHAIPVLIPVFLFLGIVFAFVAERYDSLYPAITLHALNNGVALLAVYSTLD
ncbi:MAG TPA: type II CAAX endopeptidase family protein, partial [Actinomycetota bacterium]|nr:type II CAAX endopeptidase family protein [Actinomycetota bacterium]